MGGHEGGELLVKGEKGRYITHPIAGTIKRGATLEEDQALADALHASIKDRAEHVMLVDLARNDVNRVCDPLSTRVDRLMIVQKFSHVQHLTSEVSGILRPGKRRFNFIWYRVADAAKVFMRFEQVNNVVDRSAFVLSHC